MDNSTHENHLDVFENRFELHINNSTSIYNQGIQTPKAQERYKLINDTLNNGYLDNLVNSIDSVDFSKLEDVNKKLISNIVNGVTSEVGRALVGLTFLQLTIKSITPEQSVRLHKGATRRGTFSWEDGISMRTIDSTYNTPFLRRHGLLKLNSYGLFMTRSLAENYPYSSLYKAEMRGPFKDWIAIVDAIENSSMNPQLGLAYLMCLLKNRSDDFIKNAERACRYVQQLKGYTFNEIKLIISSFFNNTNYSARAFEVVLHAFFQAINDLNLFDDDITLVPLSQMRSANKKHGNIGDIELKRNNMIIESWDAKYGKPYLRDELEELRDKLLFHQDITIAGFVVDSAVDMRDDIIKRKEDIETETGAEILLLSFDEWVDYKLNSFSESNIDIIAYHWILAIVESFSQKRSDIAPIDEPCDNWIHDLINLLE